MRRSLNQNAATDYTDSRRFFCRIAAEPQPVVAGAEEREAQSKDFEHAVFRIACSLIGAAFDRRRSLESV